MQFKVFLQEEGADCGHTCLQMIAFHYRTFYSLEYLRRKTGTLRGGVTFLHIRHTARQLGFDTAEIKIDWKNLYERVELPCILHWAEKHYVVLYKITSKRGNYYFHIADPAFGKITLPLEQFLQRWYARDADSGFAMALYPDETKGLLQEEAQKGKVHFYSSYLFTQVYKLRKTIFSTAALLFISGGASFLAVKANQYLIDKGIAQKSTALIYQIGIFMLLIALSRLLSEVVHQFVIQKAAHRLSLDNMKAFLKRLLILNPRFFEDHKVSELLQRMDEHSRVEEFTTNYLPQFIYNISIYIFYAAILIPLNMQLFVWMFTYSILGILWTSLFTQKRKIINYQKYDTDVELRGMLYEFISGMQEIKLFRGDLSALAMWEIKKRKENQLELQAQKVNSLESAGTKFLGAINLCVFSIVSALAVTRGALSIGQFWSVGFIIGQLTMPLEFIAGFIHHYSEAGISGQRINAVFSKETEWNEVDNNLAPYSNTDEEKLTDVLKKEQAYIRFDDIRFSYDDIIMPDVLHGFFADIRLGCTTAIVGESGSGKSTLAKLLLKLLQPDAGHIYIDHLPLHTIHPDLWRKKCAAVFQDGIILSDTIAVNIAMNRQDICTSRMENACRVAGILDFIQALPNGFQTNLSQAGINLSKGQFQRILIARAIYAEPDILIFDEATSALDARTEYHVMNNLWSYFPGKTVIIIAHRLSTIQNADTILMMKNGEIIEEGTHDELFARRGSYHELLNYQVRGALPDTQSGQVTV